MLKEREHVAKKERVSEVNCWLRTKVAEHRMRTNSINNAVDTDVSRCPPLPIITIDMFVSVGADGAPMFKPPCEQDALRAVKSCLLTAELRTLGKAWRLMSSKDNFKNPTVTWVTEEVSAIEKQCAFNAGEKRNFNRWGIMFARSLVASWKTLLLPEHVEKLKGFTDDATRSENTYDTIYDNIRDLMLKRQSEYREALDAADELKKKEKEKTPPQLHAACLASLTQSAAIAHVRVANLIRYVAASTDGTPEEACMKRAFRTIEKAACTTKFFYRAGGTSDEQLDFSGAFDLARGAVQYTSMAGIRHGVNKIDELATAGYLLIVRVKNRFRSKEHGWADVLINFSFQKGPAAGHVCEVQLVHAKMWVIRSKLEDCVAYSNFRTVHEIAKLRGGRGSNAHVPSGCVAETSTSPSVAAPADRSRSPRRKR